MPRIGLRARLVAALVVTAAATLAVAALALLSPLEHRLRRDDLRFLTENTLAAAPALHELSSAQLSPHSPPLRRFARALGRRTGARVVVFDAHGRELADTDPDALGNEPNGGPYDDVARALRTGRRVRSVRGAGGNGQARLALPVVEHDQRLAIALRRSLAQTHATVGVVRRAFATAAVVGLGLAVVLGIALATALLRRLRRLRDAARRLADEGLHPEVPEEAARDEVGDLARSLSAMQARLRHQEDARRAFVATASHELRTPLASLDAMLELLDEDLASTPPDLDDATPRVSAARAQTRRLIALANDLLELTRLDTEVTLRSEPVELGEICRAVLAEFAIRAGERDVSIGLEGEDVPCWVRGDPDSIARIARVLIDNALRFSPSGQRVMVAVSSSAGMASMAVTDCGPGIPDDERDLIFDRFQRGSLPGDAGGFGLGLAIGRELAQRMEGDLVCSDTHVGARFELRLPSLATPPAVPAIA